MREQSASPAIAGAGPATARCLAVPPQAGENVGQPKLDECAVAAFDQCCAPSGQSDAAYAGYDAPCRGSRAAGLKIAINQDRTEPSREYDALGKTRPIGRLIRTRAMPDAKRRACYDREMRLAAVVIGVAALRGPIMLYPSMLASSGCLAVEHS
jgi:hypothetical protein